MALKCAQCVTMCILAVLVSASLAQLVSVRRANNAFALPTPVPTVMEVDLRSGASSALPTGVTWHSELTANTQECACDRQGVLKLTFDPPTRAFAVINMTFEDSNGFTFNVGDSATNNGYAGDSNTQKNDAEVHSVNKNMYFYGRDNPSGGTYGLLHSQANYVAVNPYSAITLKIGDELATAHNGQSYLYINSHKLFALRGQTDSSSGGVNHDVYLGMNRVVGTSSRSGTGLCKVTVKFLPA